MDKTETINAIYEACRLHSWIELVTDNHPTEPIQVKVSSTMLREGIEVLQEKIGEPEAQDVPVTIHENVITFENLTRRDYDGERYEHYQYGKKL